MSRKRSQHSSLPTKRTSQAQSDDEEKSLSQHIEEAFDNFLDGDNTMKELYEQSQLPFTLSNSQISAESNSSNIDDFILAVQTHPRVERTTANHENKQTISHYRRSNCKRNILTLADKEKVKQFYLEKKTEGTFKSVRKLAVEVSNNVVNGHVSRQVLTKIINLVDSGTEVPNTQSRVKFQSFELLLANFLKTLETRDIILY
ncbi:hypothetical protein RCL1_001471 [Eukaryota sp. TZLM3-RCL]